MKNYKAVSPIETITKIRNILNSLNIFVKEEYSEHSNDLHSVRITIDSSDLNNLDIGTNGKGVTYQYCLASGYAELMERIQNYIIFKGYKNAVKYNINYLKENSVYKKILIEKGLVLDFFYDPREKYLSTEDILNQEPDLYLKLFPFLTKENMTAFFKDDLDIKESICVPFYSAKDKKEIFLSLDLLFISCMSNGMASGNTKEEALIQGFCEIFERYASYMIYYNNITPPDIPIELFKGKKIYDLISNVAEEKKCKIYLKDCSLGIGLPTFGVLVIDEKTGKYDFDLGSSLNPDIAIERCLTELFQSSNGLRWHDILFEDYCNNPLYTEEYIYINGINLLKNGSGNWHKGIFSKNFSYEFMGLNYTLNNKSDKKDLDFIKNLINNKLGFNIYIRDVSFLNFNSYYIIVPGMSQFPNKKEHYLALKESYSKFQLIRNVKSLKKEEIKEMCTILNNDYANLKKSYLNFNEFLVYHTNKDLKDLDLELLLLMLNYKVSNFEEAYFYIKEFLYDKDFYQFKYYFGIKEYLKLKLEKKDDNEIRDSLTILYSDEIDEIIQDFKYPEDIFNHHEWCSCFDCDSCQIKSDCHQFDLLRLLKDIQKIQKDNTINQNRIGF